MPDGIQIQPIDRYDSGAIMPNMTVVYPRPANVAVFAQWLFSEGWCYLLPLFFGTSTFLLASFKAD